MSRTTPGQAQKDSKGGRVDLPECPERRRQAQKHKKVSVFSFGESVTGQRPATRSKKNFFFVLLCFIVDIREGQPRPPSECCVFAPASFLTFGKVNDRPPQTDIFFGRRGGGVQITTLLIPAAQTAFARAYSRKTLRMSQYARSRVLRNNGWTVGGWRSCHDRGLGGKIVLLGLAST